MHPNALLELSAELLHAVLKFDSAADGIVSAFFRQNRNLGPRERETISETVFAVVRERLALQHLAQTGNAALERRLAIMAWRGSPSFLRAALAPHEVTWLEQIQAIDRSKLPEKLRHNLPDWLSIALQAQVPNDGFWPLVASLNEPAALDLRVNTLKAKREDVQAALRAQGVESSFTPYSPWGLRVTGKPALTKLDVFTRGDFEVQDEGSQLLALLTGAARGEMVADFCAGAGGKTLALGAMMRNTGRLYAFDTSGHRLDALKPRLARSGLSNIYPAQIAHERDERIKRLAGKMDRVLVDAPCSGLGTLRRNPDLKWRQSPQTIATLQKQQSAILAGAARLLRPGGRLVYATCSLLAAENEEVAAGFDETHGRDFVPVDVVELLTPTLQDASSGLTQAGRLRLWPHVHGTDGFFAAIWQRR